MFNAGDKVWLAPDYKGREVPTECGAIVEKITGGGRVRVKFRLDGIWQRKTVDPKRLRVRDNILKELSER